MARTTRAATTAKHDAETVVAELRRLGAKSTRDGMARYAIPNDKAFGVTVADLHQVAKRLGRSHDLAAELWASGWYEARMLAYFVDEPERVTPRQMDQWCRDFDSWAICDTACFHLFDRTPHAWKRIEPWSRRTGEFARRAAFALMASLALHDKETDDGAFAEFLPLIERCAGDERNFVKKGISWALRSIGERSRDLHALSLALAQRLAESPEPARRWVGKDAARQLTSASVRKRLARR